MTKNLSGRWKLINEGSDYYPGLDSLSDAPLILKLLGTTEVEFYRIEKRKTMEIEELYFTYVTKGVSMSRSYQIGVLNYESINGSNVVLGIIQNCDEFFHEFSLVRLGPKVGQSSREVFRLDPGTDRVTLQIDLLTPEGNPLKLIKYLIRFDEKEKVENVPFKHAVNSMGWKLFEFWDSSVLSNANAKIIRAVKIKSQSQATNTETKVLETIWNDPEYDSHFQGDKFDWTSIAKSYGTRNLEAEEIVEFIVKVSIRDSQWFVAHRYREFDALRKFILAQNPYNTDFQQVDSKFPGKYLGPFRKSAIDKRVEGLEGFLCYYLENARFCRQNSIDALCSFLQIPENMHRLALLKAAAEPPPPPPAPLPVAPTMKIVTKTSGPVSVMTKTSDSTKPEKQSKNILNMFSSSHTKKESTPTAAAAAPSATSSSTAATTNPATENNLPTVPSQPTYSNNTTASTTPANNNNNNANKNNTTTTATSTTNKTNTSSSVAAATTTTSAGGGADKPPAPNTAPLAIQTNIPDTASIFEPVLSAAQKRLSSRLNHGIPVVKHGRQGNPHPRTLQCDDEVQSLIIQAPDHYQKISFADIEGLRRGNEIDPISSPEAIAKYNAESQQETPQKTMRRRSSMGMLFSKDEVLFGTATLRRTCKPDDLPLCVSLLMRHRTMDLQFANEADANFFYANMKEIIGNN